MKEEEKEKVASRVTRGDFLKIATAGIGVAGIGALLPQRANALTAGGVRTATKVVAAYNSLDTTRADYVCDGINDDVEIQAALNAVNSIGGGEVVLLEGTYSIMNTITGKTNVLVRGMGALPYCGYGTVLSLSNNCHMFSYPGGTSNWGFSNITFWGNTRSYSIFNCSNESSGFGTYDVHFFKCSFYQCRPAIYAINAWDWWLTDCDFKDCGNHGVGNLWNQPAIYMKNTNYGGGQGPFCNDWHFLNCTANPVYGRFVWSDYNNLNGTYPTSNRHLFFYGCAIEGDRSTGHEVFFGYAAECKFIGCYFGETPNGTSLINIQNTHDISYGNQWIGCDFIDYGSYAIVTASEFDLIEGNLFSSGYAQGQAQGHINLAAGSYKCRVLGNNCNPFASFPLVYDQGSANTIVFNDGSDGDLVATADIPVTQKLKAKINGTTCYLLVAT